MAQIFTGRCTVHRDHATLGPGPLRLADVEAWCRRARALYAPDGAMIENDGESLTVVWDTEEAPS